MRMKTAGAALIALLLVGASSAATPPPAHAAIEVARADDILADKYGVFVHYVPGLTVNGSGAVVSDVNTLANNFDATGFAEDLEDFGVEYVKFTAWHANMIPLYPSAVQTAWRGSGTSSTRDLIGDMIDAVAAKGIKIILYTHPRVGHSFSEADMAATGWGSGGTTWCSPPSGQLCPNPNPSTFSFATWNDFILEAYDELLDRYGDDIDGIYVDEGDGAAQSQNVVDYPALRALIKQYNLPMFHNYYGNLYSADIADKEYWNWEEFASTDGDTWPASAYRSVSATVTTNWWTSHSSTATALRYTADDMYRYTVLQAATNRVGGGVAWSAGVYPGGGWEKDVASALTSVGTRIKAVDPSIRGAFSSPSYPTADGTAVEDLTWGVATRSPDDLRTFIHVLNPPSGATLTLPVPADGKQFLSARLLSTGQAVTLSQTSTGVSLSLPSGASWDPVDTVLELTSTTPSVGGSATATSSVENSDWGLSRVVDGNLRSVSGSRGWTSASNLTVSHTEALTIDLGSTQSITDVVLSPRTDPSDLGQGFPVDFTIATSTDGSTWTTQVTVTGAAVPSRPQQYAFERASARYVRIEGTQLRPNPNDMNQYRMVLAEVSVRDRPPTGSDLIINNLYHHRDLQGTQVVVSTGVNDVVITPAPKSGAETTWTIAHSSGQWYTITNQYSNRRLTGTSDYFPGRTDVNMVRQSSATVSDAQLWRFVPAGDGTYRIENKQYGMVLHGTGSRYPGLIDINSVVMVPTSWDSDEQRWTISKQ
ncbi:discoidin domain-containing protein [Microbacterium sp. NPDC057407]|uniref:discoidin domain-containing protein n=1 Tax=Microbacterium sp. NPDC057407 TaxID=3346120 RepID=UPI00366D3A4C